MVQRDGLVDKLRVTADGTGVVGHAGSVLLGGTADRVGLTRALSKAMEPTRQRASAHDPGVVLRDLVVMLADGGDCLADLGALRDQEGSVRRRGVGLDGVSGDRLDRRAVPRAPA